MKRRRRRSTSPGMLLAAFACGAAGCALVPGVPAGPIGGPGARIGISYAYAYSPTTVRSSNVPGEPHAVGGNGSMAGGLVPLFPLRAMVRVSPAPFIDFGTDLGWIDGGLQLRVGPLDARRQLPWGVDLEWRHGHDAGAFLHVYRIRAEAYPALARTPRLDVHGVLTLGVSTGNQLYSVVMRRPGDENLDGLSGPDFNVLRRETRLELSAGAHFRAKTAAAISVALMPWLVMEHGRERDPYGDDPLEFQGFGSSWGLALVAGGSLVWEKKE